MREISIDISQKKYEKFSVLENYQGRQNYNERYHLTNQYSFQYSSSAMSIFFHIPNQMICEPEFLLPVSYSIKPVLITFFCHN